MERKVIQKNTEWYKSKERQELMKAAERAGKIFERVVKEREEYELRELARKIRTA